MQQLVTLAERIEENIFSMKGYGDDALRRACIDYPTGNPSYLSITLRDSPVWRKINELEEYARKQKIPDEDTRMIIATAKGYRFKVAERKITEKEYNFLIK